MKINLSRGFTLTELLIVISILGILSALVIVNLSSARQSARDAQRISDLGTIQTALETYFNDHGRYPVPGGGDGDYSGFVLSNTAEWNSLATQLARYLPQMPTDPINNEDDSSPVAGGFTYAYGNVGNAEMPVGYDLIAQLETNNAQRCEIHNFTFGFNRNETCNEDNPRLYVVSERLIRN